MHHTALRLVPGPTVPPVATGSRSTPTLVCADIDLSAVKDNVAAVRAHAGAPVMAVVKADAFGHGAVPVARAALSAGATWLGVCRVDEALVLRAAGVSAPVLAWLDDVDAMAAAAAAADIDLSVSSVAELDALAAQRLGTRVHLKLDTGMHRSGCPAQRWPELVARAVSAQSSGAVQVVGVWSHLSHATRALDPHNQRQVAAFTAGLSLAHAAGLRPEVRHLCNTAAAVGIPDARFDLVRMGAGLVGIDEADAGLRPALTLRARVLQVRTLAAGDGVGYDHAGTVTRETTVALLPLGYADGIPRRSSPGASVSWRGHRLRLLGRVSMDQVVVDAGALPVRPGDEVVVIGTGAKDPSVQEWARWSRTIPHEIYTGLGTRVTRRHRGMEDPGVNPTRLTVAVLGGGTSTEHDVSRASADGIAAAARSLGHEVLDVVIDRGGTWRAPGAHGLPAVAEVLRGVDVVVPALHGTGGEDGTVQGLLDCLQVRYVGSGVLASATCLDKNRTKLVLSDAGVGVAPGVVVRRADGVAAAVGAVLAAGLRGALFVKPMCGGSSIGVSRLAEGADLAAALATAWESDESALIEPHVEGREIDLAVLEMPDGTLRCAPPLEIHPDPDEDFFTERAKYGAAGTRFVVPAPIEAGTAEALEAIAVGAFRALGCSGLARVDTFVTPTGIVVNEVNTMPGFTPHSQYPQMWAAEGVGYAHLVATLLSSALTRGAVRCPR
jgi:alanine racemase